MNLRLYISNLCLKHRLKLKTKRGHKLNDSSQTNLKTDYNHRLHEKLHHHINYDLLMPSSFRINSLLSRSGQIFFDNLLKRCVCYRFCQVCIAACKGSSDPVKW